MPNSFGLVVPVPKKGGRGRPTKYTQATVDELLGLLEKGSTEAKACKQVGITTKVYRQWRVKFPGFNSAAVIATEALPKPIEKPKPAKSKKRVVKVEAGNKYGLVLPKPPKKKGPGQPTKYRQPLVDGFLACLETGAPESVACAEAGINTDTLAKWKHRYPEFVEAVNAAKAASHLTIIHSVRRSVHGYPCMRCTDGTESFYGKDGELQEVKCPACAGTRFAVKPDGKLGLTLLERRLPSEYGRHSTTDVRVTGGVTVAHVAAEVKLEQLTPEQVAALAWEDDDEPLLLEAEE